MRLPGALQAPDVHADSQHETLYISTCLMASTHASVTSVFQPTLSQQRREASTNHQ